MRSPLQARWLTLEEIAAAAARLGPEGVIESVVRRLPIYPLEILAGAQRLFFVPGTCLATHPRWNARRGSCGSSDTHEVRGDW